MNLSNATKKQHFLPQVEQRLNAANPKANHPSRQRIYSFEIVDRGSYKLKLENAKGRLISENLAILDLFSFDVSLDKKNRMNFELLFMGYEERIKIYTENLLKKLEVGNSDIGEEVINLFAAKLLNFLRNPFSIKKILNTFGMLAAYQPTDPTDLKYFEKILVGKRPHQKAICEQLGIDDLTYISWLKMLFLLFVDQGEGELTILEATVKSMFESNQLERGILVCRYSHANCLLSDRAFSTNIDAPGANSFDFNLRSDAFIRYTFVDIAVLVPPNAPQTLVERYKNSDRAINLLYQVDDFEQLRNFNQNVILQSHRRVFCASKDGFLL